MIDQILFLMWQSALQVGSTSQVVQGNVKYLHTKHVKLRNKI